MINSCIDLLLVWHHCFRAIKFLFDVPNIILNPNWVFDRRLQNKFLGFYSELFFCVQKVVRLYGHAWFKIKNPFFSKNSFVLLCQVYKACFHNSIYSQAFMGKFYSDIYINN